MKNTVSTSIVHNLPSTPVSKAREITLYSFRKPTIVSKPANDFKSTFHELKTFLLYHIYSSRYFC